MRKQQPSWDDLLTSIENFRPNPISEKQIGRSESNESNESNESSESCESSNFSEPPKSSESTSLSVPDQGQLPGKISFVDGYNRLNESFSYLFNLAWINRSFKESQQKILDEYRDTLITLVNSYMGNVRSQIQRDVWKKEELVKNVGDHLIQKKGENLKDQISMKVQSQSESTITADLINKNIDTLNTKLNHCVFTHFFCSLIAHRPKTHLSGQYEKLRTANRHRR